MFYYKFFFFMCIKIPKNLLTKYYQENKDYILKGIKRYLKRY